MNPIPKHENGGGHGGARSGAGAKVQKPGAKIRSFRFALDVNTAIDREVERRNAARGKDDPVVTATLVMEELVRANLSTR